ncbi:MAG: hypothetical protein IPL12_06660 [Bacteroidetes bacterium]|nr:hypothetical protein [Bacteroidota bacterium]
MRMDGGAGGSRSNPQHSFRLSFDDNALGEETIHEQLIPNIPFGIPTAMCIYEMVATNG